jgi:hypothetical protein
MNLEFEFTNENVFDTYDTYNYSFILNGVLSFYISLYLFLHFTPIFKKELNFSFKNNNKLTIVHLLTYGMSSIHSVIVSGSCILYFLNVLNIAQMFSVYYFSIAYFTGDLVIIFLNMIFTNNIAKEDFVFMIHHFITSILELYIIFSKNNENIDTMVYYLNMSLMAEFPVIFLNIIWFMKNTVINYYEKPLFKVCFVSLWINYLIFRFINLNMLAYSAFQNNMIIEFLLGFPIVILNNYWFYKLTKIFISVLNISKNIIVNQKTK